MRKKNKNLKQLYINGEKAGGGLISGMIQALNSQTVRTEKGGYLFKAGSDADKLYFGIIPCIEEGERTHHYDIVMPEQLEYILTGSIIPEGIFTILFIPKTKEFTDEVRNEYRSAYMDLAEGLLARGLSEPGKLDDITVLMLKESALWPEIPQSLLEITAQDKSTPRKS